jgi:3-hydroxyacyl-CoA dehydrogenase/enoyl-CoA hydratase/3-hydroxybutyryl-CoA epimerase
MINEAARCLQEKIVSSPEDVDLGMIMGTGFPPFRGGLLRYADSIGLAKIVSALEGYASRYGMRFSPSEALRAYAEKGKFYS